MLACFAQKQIKLIRHFRYVKRYMKAILKMSTEHYKVTCRVRTSMVLEQLSILGRYRCNFCHRNQNRGKDHRPSVVDE